ncbi:hypothetical protein JD486_21090 [Aeromonas caviae]|nr:hypothetical protein [Aeromonas caviae]
MMIYLQKRVIDQNGRSPSSTENSKIRCGMTAKSTLVLLLVRFGIITLLVKREGEAT